MSDDDLKEGGARESGEGDMQGAASKESPRDEVDKELPQKDGDGPKDEENAAGSDEEELYRCEIVANNSVQDDIVEVLEAACPGILYTIVPAVHGRGKNDRKLSTATWPETNFILFAYVTKDKIPAVKRAVRAVKETFHGEGIKLFIMKGCLPEDV